MGALVKENGQFLQYAGGSRVWVGTEAARTAAIANDKIPDGTIVMTIDDAEDTPEYVDKSTYDSKMTEVDGDISDINDKLGVIGKQYIYSFAASEFTLSSDHIKATKACNIPAGTYICECTFNGNANTVGQMGYLYAPYWGYYLWESNGATIWSRVVKLTETKTSLELEFGYFSNVNQCNGGSVVYTRIA